MKKSRQIVTALTLFGSTALFILNSNNRNLNNGSKSFNQSINSPTESVRKCYALQQSISNIIQSDINNWSITILDQSGNQITDINGQIPRVPASNQKLITTAYALDRLGLKYKLYTTLFRNWDGSYELNGEGDPDFSLQDIVRASGALSKNNSNTTPYQIQLTINEEDPSQWWPVDWHILDRNRAYGAPITRLALSSNAFLTSNKSHLSVLSEHLMSSFNNDINNLNIVFDTPKRFREFYFGRSVIYRKESASMPALLSLANSESHNFTAEVLLRHAARNWNVSSASKRAMTWLVNKNIPVKGFRIRDGSGLSRNNRLTTRGLSHLIYYMSDHPLFKYYISSMSIMGLRGTLNSQVWDLSLIGQFYGKTGTLKGIRAITGILLTPTGDRYVSIISYDQIDPDYIISRILQKIILFNECH